MKREYTKPRRTIVDLVGKVFGRLTVLRALGSFKSEIHWLCECVCGGTAEVSTSDLNTRNTMSCGCAKVERILKINAGHITHGKSGSRAYVSWNNMMYRIYDPTCPHYHRYGGRGLIVEDRFHDFNEFYAYMGDAPDGLTLERKNNELGYVTGNMVWATQGVQNRNTRQNVKVCVDGVEMVATDAASAIGMTLSKFLYRHHRGMSVDEIKSVPHNAKRPVMFNGVLTNLQSVSDETGVKYHTLWARIKRQGLSIEDAVKKGIPC